MVVTYRHRELGASPHLISQLEQRLGQSLPPSYHSYLLEQDGGWLDNNHEAVKNIFGLGNVPASASMWRVLDTYHNRVPVWLLPVARDEYGNLFAISLHPSSTSDRFLQRHSKKLIKQEDFDSSD